MKISEVAMQRVGACHCGALKVIAAGEPERVYFVPLQGMPAPHRHCLSFWRHVPTLAGAARGRVQDLRARSGQRIADPVLLLPDLRQQFTLGKRAQPDAVRGGRRCARKLRSRAELGNFRGVDASLGRTAERDGALPAWTLACHELRAAGTLPCADTFAEPVQTLMKIVALIVSVGFRSGRVLGAG
jgi:hypothetical protein